MIIRKLLIIILLLPAWLSAKNPEVKEFDWQFGSGYTYLYDDYLSPMPYSGISLRYTMGSEKVLNWGQDSTSDPLWAHRLEWTLLPAYTKSPSGSRLYFGYSDLRSTFTRRMFCTKGFEVHAGWYTSLNGGGRYCPINGNNPGSADLRIDLGAALSAQYRMHLFKKEMLLRYRFSTSLLGLAFSPGFTESYYEIFYLNHYENVVLGTTPFNKRQWQQQLSADLPFSGKKSSFRVSIWNDGVVSHLNGLTVRNLNTQFTLGYVHYFKTL